MPIQAKVITNTTSSGSPQDEIPVQCAEDKVLTRRRLLPRSLRPPDKCPCYESSLNRLRLQSNPTQFPKQHRIHWRSAWGRSCGRQRLFHIPHQGLQVSRLFSVHIWHCRNFPGWHQGCGRVVRYAVANRKGADVQTTTRVPRDC